MSGETITTTPPGALQRLGLALQEYKKLSGKTSEDVLAQAGGKVVHGNQDPRFGPTFQGLRGSFDEQKPPQGSITRSTVLRGFRLGRRHFGGRGVNKGISAEATLRAEKLMGPYLRKHSILANVSYMDGRISVQGVRVGIRGRRLRGRHVTAYGKRARMSNRGVAGLAGFALGGDSEMRMPGDIRLNFRAVATIMEINLREAGRRFLSVGFLLKRFQRIQGERVLREVNPRSAVSLQSEAEMGGNPDSGNVSLRITSFVPGTAEIGTQRGIFARVLQAVTADIEIYLARKQGDLLRDTVKQAVA